ncbi:unnamed protein product, partial [Symbiodinium microadriaticum]
MDLLPVDLSSESPQIARPGSLCPAAKISKEQPLPTPSEDPSKLLLQIDESGKALRLLEFLENAVHSPAFEMKHAVRALDTLVVQRPSLNEEDLARLGD